MTRGFVQVQCVCGELAQAQLRRVSQRNPEGYGKAVFAATCTVCGRPLELHVEATPTKEIPSLLVDGR